ncbi:phosphopantetheine-binding protein [Carnobacterium sp. FSL E2-0243]|uniref:phosphopantetheine-binding protein n=1 Tax=Carnobacterium sp. FSL E2-0243 TaxID=2921365 RepID=UPI0030F67A0E
MLLSNYFLEKKIDRLLLKTSKIGKIKIRDETKIRDDLGIDSLSFITLVIELEKKFDTKLLITESDFSESLSVMRIKEIVKLSIKNK